MLQNTYKELISQIYENNNTNLFGNLSIEELVNCITLIREITCQRQSQKSTEPGMHEEILQLWESLWDRINNADNIYEIARNPELEAEATAATCIPVVELDLSSLEDALKDGEGEEEDEEITLLDILVK